MRVALLVLIALMGVARADDLEDRRQQARALSEDALRKIKDANDYGTAIDLFSRAYALTDDPAYLLNVAVAARKAKLPQQAVETYRRYIDVTGASLTPELREQIAQEIVVITRASATIIVSTGGAPANILLDRRPIGSASKAAPLVLLVATEGGLIHDLHASRPGHDEATAGLGKLEPGSTREIVIEPTLTRTTTRVTLSSAPLAAHLVLGTGRILGRTPLTLELAPGDYEVFARIPGREEGRELVHVTLGPEQTVMFRLNALPTWWARHKTTVYIGGVVSLLVVGALLTPTIYDQFKPDGVIRNFP